MKQAQNAAMTRYLYLRVLADEATVRAIHRDIARSDTSIKETHARRETGGNWWNWKTSDVEFQSIHDLDEKVCALLTEFRSVFPIIRGHSTTETEIYLEIVTNCTREDDPGGLALSAQTIRLLAELGAAVDYDLNRY